jgi:transcriptional regulator with XRE-family HTH domain
MAEVIGKRIEALIEDRRTSQSAVARAIGVSQPSIGRLISGETRETGKLLELARELRTTPEYLVGETDDPDPKGPARVAEQRVLVTLEVALPSEAALTRMFEGLLAVTKDEPTEEAARMLARLLPVGLAQLQDLRGGHGPGASRDRGAAPQAPAITDRESRPVPRTSPRS